MKLFCALALLVVSVACSCLAAVPPAVVTVTPATYWLRPGEIIAYHAVVASTKTKSQRVSWSATSGIISQAGVFTAGTEGGPATITATWAWNRTVKGTALAQVVAPPKTYPNARTDKNIAQLPDPMPLWGGATGAGTFYTNPAFNGVLTVRCTDMTTNALGRTMQTADTGEPTLWAIDSRHLLLRPNGGNQQAIAFDPVARKCTATPLIFRYTSAVFSHYDPQEVYALDGTRLRDIDVAPDWQTVANNDVVFDFATCLPSGYVPKWTGVFTLSWDDSSFRVAYSTQPGQGSGYIVAAYLTNPVSSSVPPGCYILNTRDGTVSGPNGLIGSVDDGVNPLADRFTLHEGGGGRHPGYAIITASLHQPDGSSGCLAGNCKANGPVYIWEVGTKHLRPCGPYNCDGHMAQGITGFATGKKYTYHDYSNPAQPLTPLASFPTGFPDQHGSWANTNQDDSVPAFLASSDVPSVYPFPVWGYDEILAVIPDGSQLVERIGPTLNSGSSPYFIVANAIGVVSQDGMYVAFTSDMCGQPPCPNPAPLGNDTDGSPHGDVFIMFAGASITAPTPTKGTKR